MSCRAVAVVAALVFGSLGTANASADELLSPAWYVDMQLGKSSVSSHAYEDSHDPVFGVALGRQFTPHVGVDLFARTMSFRLFDALAGDDSYYPHLHLGVEVVARLLLSDSFSVFGTAGAGRTSMHADSNSKGDYRVTDYTGGVGVSYELSKPWSLKLGGTHFSHTGVNTVQFGAQYRW